MRKLQQGRFLHAECTNYKSLVSIKIIVVEPLLQLLFFSSGRPRQLCGFSEETRSLFLQLRLTGLNPDICYHSRMMHNLEVKEKKITAGIVKVILSMLQELSFLSTWWSLSSGCQVTEQGAAPDLFQLSVNPEQGCAITRWQVPFLFFLPGGSGCLDWPLKPHTHQRKHASTHVWQPTHTQFVSVTHPYFKS